MGSFRDVLVVFLLRTLNRDELKIAPCEITGNKVHFVHFPSHFPDTGLAQDIGMPVGWSAATVFHFFLLITSGKGFRLHCGSDYLVVTPSIWINPPSPTLLQLDKFVIIAWGFEKFSDLNHILSELQCSDWRIKWNSYLRFNNNNIPSYRRPAHQSWWFQFSDYSFYIGNRLHEKGKFLRLQGESI